MIDIFLNSLGWVSTLLVLCGFYFNSIQKRNYAFVAWILGDIGWVVYDVFISNWSHMSLSFIIIVLNAYGMYKDSYSASKINAK